MSTRLLRSLLVTIAFVNLASVANALEQILAYDAQIDIARDGTLTVTEAIAVSVEGKKIKRGIYRDFPTRYSGRFGERVVVPFDVVRVMRDGSPEHSHVQDIDGGVRLYIGKQDQNVAPGIHRYELIYTTKRQIGFFERHDELYWNVTGNFWDFQILQASATVRLPGSVDPETLASEGYTGPPGARGRDLRSRVDPATGEIRFETTKALPQTHGLTIVAQFPKGIVTPPSEQELWQEFVAANPALLTGLAGAALLLAYYLVAWIAVGRDPLSGTIIPRFEPPRGQSPAAMRHLIRMGYDEACFSAALVNMAVKGYLRIEETSGSYTLVRSGAGPEVLSPDERRIADQLIPSGITSFAIRQIHHAKIRKAIAAFKRWLWLANEGGLFRANRGAIFSGLALSAIAIGVTGSAMKDEILGGSNGPPVILLVSFVAVWSLGAYSLYLKVANCWKDAFDQEPGVSRVTVFASAIVGTGFLCAFIAAEIFAIGMFAKLTSVAMMGALMLLILPNFAFYHLLRRPTRAGRRLMDEIEGFKMYLRTAEGDDIRRLAAPKPTPELFERLLPYAIALDVENEWAERFSDVLEQAAVGDPHGYTPRWYSGSDFRAVGSRGWMSAVGSSLGRAVTTHSSAPGSSSGGSSGGGGGGSSGGGGGGGGGGGW